MLVGSLARANDGRRNQGMKKMNEKKEQAEDHRNEK